MRSRSLLLSLLLTACAPASIAEAEAQRDVAWLDANGSRAALEALGRIADHDTKASTALSRRTGERDAYHAAWLAHTRGAAWGDDMLHTALASPTELPIAVAELPTKDPRLEDFAGDLEKGIAGAAPEPAAAAVTVLASLGPSAKPQLVRLLDLESTREVTCLGLDSADVSPESRVALTLASPAARATPACQKTLFAHVESDPKILAWLGREGEHELFDAAAVAVPCPKLAQLWDTVFASPRVTFVPLEPALTASAARCPQQLDTVMARALPSHKNVRVSVLRALDHEAAHAERLDATCRQLPRLSHGRAIDTEVRTLAERVHDKGCAH